MMGLWLSGAAGGEMQRDVWWIRRTTQDELSSRELLYSSVPTVNDSALCPSKFAKRADLMLKFLNRKKIPKLSEQNKGMQGNFWK